MKKLLPVLLLFLTSLCYGQNLSNQVEGILVPTTGSCWVVGIYPLNYDITKEKSVQRIWNGRCNSQKRIDGYGTLTIIFSETSKVIFTGNYENGFSEGVFNSEYTSPKLKRVFSGTHKNSEKYYGTETKLLVDLNTRIVYEGSFKDGDYSGKGSYYEEGPSGNIRYEGNFERGKFNGYGNIYYLKEGGSWSGNFTNNKRNGIGTQSNPNGSSTKVQYANDEVVYTENIPSPGLSPEQLRQIFPPTPSIVPFTCTTYGGITNCR